MKEILERIDIFWDQHETPAVILLIAIAIIVWLYFEIRRSPSWIECDECGYPDNREAMVIKEGCYEVLVCKRCAGK